MYENKQDIYNSLIIFPHIKINKVLFLFKFEIYSEINIKFIYQKNELRKRTIHTRRFARNNQS